MLDELFRWTNVVTNATIPIHRNELMADKPDPFDVKALESAVNDSATRVSAIWISFLVFSLYLLIAVGTVTQRQLFLSEPTKLPVLNIDLPLWWFFLLAPVLFVIFHAYVLLQVLLLGRTAAAYNAAVDRVGPTSDENASLRQRLANTLFAQIFAGSPRERGGVIGFLLKAMAWITLAIAPILIVLAFQFRFLPYHSNSVTWTHRTLILIELIGVFLIWPLAIDANRDFRWPSFAWRPRRFVTMLTLVRRPGQRYLGGLWFLRQTTPFATCAVFIIVSFSIASFLGEPHLNLLALRPLASVQCDGWINPPFNRLSLPQIHAIDEDKLAKYLQRASARNLSPYASERTQDFRDRDFNCSDLSSADLRLVDLSGASLVNASLDSASLDGALLNAANLQGASLDSANLPSASLAYSNLRTTIFRFADLNAAILDHANLEGADMNFALLQGASIQSARLQGADLGGAKLQGASLVDSAFQGASFIAAQMQGANLTNARFQGVNLTAANLQGAILIWTRLQGTEFTDVDWDHAFLASPYVWRANHAACESAFVNNPIPDATLFPREGDKKLTPVTETQVAHFVERSVERIPRESKKKRVASEMQRLLIYDQSHDSTVAIAEAWRKCEYQTHQRSEETFADETAKLLLHLACDTPGISDAFTLGLIRNWIDAFVIDKPTITVHLARALLGELPQECAPGKTLPGTIKNRLARYVASAGKHGKATQPMPQISSRSLPIGAVIDDEVVRP